MGSYRDLEIYQLAFELSIKIHKSSLKLPDFELYDLTYSIASCDETQNHILTIRRLYPGLNEFVEFEDEYDKLGRKINNYIQYVESNWNNQS